MKSNRLRLINLAVVVCIVVVGAGAVLAIRHHGSTRKVMSDKPVSLTLGAGSPSATTYHLEVAATAAEQTTGLGDRTSMASDAGMIFRYEDVGDRCMWMKDMKFNLDMIWFDDQDRVTSLVANLNPTTYPQQYCGQGKYVVELNAGQTAMHGLRVGQIVKF